jgi:hypothetical protein
MIVTALFGAVVSYGGGRAVAQVSSQPAPQYSPGYWLAAADGGIYHFQTTDFGSLRGIALNKPIVGGAATPDGLGYWLVASDGGVFSFGDAHFEGSTGGITLNKPVVGMAADPNGGYWLVASDGGVFAYGGAPFYGSTGGITLNKPVVAIVPTATGRGYWLVASDGGVFAYGDAKFEGSTGGVALDKPVVGMAADPNGGYWLVASDGGVFSFGGAPFYGSTGGVTLDAPVVGIAASPSGHGYWMAGADGGVFNYGDAEFLGSAGSSPAPIAAILATPHGYPFPPGSTGYDVSAFQCPVSSLPKPSSFQIVQVSDGSIDSPTANSCYAQEAAWAGPNLSTYIFMDTLPDGTPPPQADAQACDNSLTCEGYHFGFYWAQHWVQQAVSLGYSPTLWWLDVETDGFWGQSLAVNSQVIAGAVAGLHSMGKLAGIYSDNYQWNLLTGSTLSFPGIPLWVPGAGQVSTGYVSAEQICTQTIPSTPYAYVPGEYAPYAGGNIVVVQWGDNPNLDYDYACP